MSKKSISLIVLIAMILNESSIAAQSNSVAIPHNCYYSTACHSACVQLIIIKKEKCHCLGCNDPH